MSRRGTQEAVHAAFCLTTLIACFSGGVTERIGDVELAPGQQVELPFPVRPGVGYKIVAELLPVDAADARNPSVTVMTVPVGESGRRELDRALVWRIGETQEERWIASESGPRPCSDHECIFLLRGDTGARLRDAYLVRAHK